LQEKRLAGSPAGVAANAPTTFLGAPFIAVAIWWFLPVALIPTDGEANDDPDGRDPRITNQIVDNARGSDHDRNISG
jgi:hypothetical protein